MTKIYRVRFGKLTEGNLVNKTPKGYRVKYGRFDHE